MTQKLKGFLERHNYKITLTIIKFLKILGKNHCEEAIIEIQNKHTNDKANHYDNY